MAYDSEAQYEVAKAAFDKIHAIRTQSKRKENTIRKIFVKFQIEALLPPPKTVLDWIEPEQGSSSVVPSKIHVKEAVQWLKSALLWAHRDPALKETVIKLLGSTHVTKNFEYAKIFVELKEYFDKHQDSAFSNKETKEILDKLELESAMGGCGLKTHEAFTVVPDSSEQHGAEASILKAQKEGNVRETKTGQATDPPPAEVLTAAGSGINAVRSASRNRLATEHCPLSNEALWHNFVANLFGVFDHAIQTPVQTLNPECVRSGTV